MPNLLNSVQQIFSLFLLCARFFFFHISSVIAVRASFFGLFALAFYSAKSSLISIFSYLFFLFSVHARSIAHGKKNRIVNLAFLLIGKCERSFPLGPIFAIVQEHQIKLPKKYEKH